MAMANMAIRMKNAQSASASKRNMKAQAEKTTKGLKNSAINRSQQSNGVDRTIYKTDPISKRFVQLAAVGTFTASVSMSFKETERGTVVSIGAEGYSASAQGKADFNGTASLIVDGATTFVQQFKAPSLSYGTAHMSPVGVTSFLLPRVAKSVSIGINISYTFFTRHGSMQPSSKLTKSISIPIIIPYRPQYIKPGN